ncbi:hypothetical protein [Desulfovirgula thermocuniculi]|uniref:hypothetical protein n=1 Tax=Desulfovirgula thermocuniculi TaxID=348842 RepID=UPI001B7F9DD2|nr:hypothetical protein [Desulfovirgula thermocuniculi]
MEKSPSHHPHKNPLQIFCHKVWLFLPAGFEFLFGKADGGGEACGEEQGAGKKAGYYALNEGLLEH